MYKEQSVKKGRAVLPIQALVISCVVEVVKVARCYSDAAHYPHSIVHPSLSVSVARRLRSRVV